MKFLKYNIKTFTWILAISCFIISCELFNGGDDSKKIGGGEVAWRLANQQENTVGTQPLIRGENVYFLQDGYLKGYTIVEGNKIWATQIVEKGDGDYSHSIIQDDGMLFFDQGFRIKAFKKSNGTEVWETQVTENAEEVSGIGSPIMSQDAQYLYAGRKGYVLKVRKSDGQMIKRYPLDRGVPEDVTQGATNPIISPFGDDILYVPTSYYDRTTPGEEEFGANLFAFDANTGETKWRTKVEYKIDNYISEEPKDSVVVSPPIYDISVTESAIIALQGKAIVSINRSNGVINWIHNFPQSGFDVGLAVEDGGIYAASVGHYAHRLKLKTGEEVWRQDIRFSNTSIPTVQNGRMYFNNSGGGGIWVLDTDDGSVIYQKNSPNHKNDSFDVYISSLGVGSGYMVDVGSKAVYCIKVP